MNKLNKFIRLHNAENNSVVIVNVDSISLIDTDEVDGKICSLIYLNSSSDVDKFNVNESPEKIFDMISSLNK